MNQDLKNLLFPPKIDDIYYGYRFIGSAFHHFGLVISLMVGLIVGYQLDKPVVEQSLEYILTHPIICQPPLNLFFWVLTIYFVISLCIDNYESWLDWWDFKNEVFCRWNDPYSPDQCTSVYCENYYTCNGILEKKGED